VKKLIIGLMLTVVCGCRSGAPMGSAPVGPAMPSGSVTGASNPRAAIDAFMAAVDSEDLQALGAIWGTPNGPARSQMDMTQLQQRELTMLCYLTHDSFRVMGDAPALHGTRTFAVEMKYKTLSHVGQFNVGQASDGRYYVYAIVNFAEFQDVCALKKGG
jgi:hypothetical protein